jgi:hemolysin activation/secretion protein
MKSCSLLLLGLAFLPFLGLRASTGPAAEAVTAAPPAVTIRGLVFLEDDAPLRPLAEIAGGTGIHTAYAPSVDNEAFRRAAAEALGYPINKQTIELLRSGISGYLQRVEGRLGLVRIPPQDVTSGVVQIVIVRGKLGRVNVEGARWFRPELYAQAISARPGQVLDLERIRREVEALNRNGFRSVVPTLVPGAAAGETDLRLTVEDRMPLRLVTGYNDTGSRSTDEDRVFAGLTWGNAFGLGDQLDYQFTGNPRLDRLSSHSLGYSTWRWPDRTLTVNLAYAEIEGDLPPPIEQSGESFSIGVRQEWALPAWRGWDQRLTIAADYKRTDNNILFATIPVTQNLTEIIQGRVTYALGRGDSGGYTSAALSLTVSPGGLSRRNRTSAFAGTRAFAQADYAYATLDVARLQRLPAGWGAHTSLLAQATNRNLLGSEQLAFGGANSLRGYEEGEIYADEGLVWRNELRLPAQTFGAGARAAELIPLVFWDLGWAHVHRPLPNERAAYTLSSVGMGARLAFGTRFSARFDYGWQLRETGFGGQRDSRGHLSATLSW